MNSISLPQWLDKYIFETLKSSYQPQNKDMLVVDWNRKQILNYMGTYFPRTYAESYSIYTNYFQNGGAYILDKNELLVFDFGCGTGGELIGLIDAINKCKHQISQVNITALDGNNHALHILETLTQETKKQTDFNIQLKPIPLIIDDFYDMSLTLQECLAGKKFDIVMSFKAVCEFVTKQQFEEHNPYEYLIKTFLPILDMLGIMCLADVTTYNDVAQEWLPRMLDSGISATNTKIVAQNNGYNESYFITHSRRQCDISKIAWRILKQN